MTVLTEEDIIQLIEQDEWMMTILKAAKTLDLPDWWVCAGFVRAKIWDYLHGYKERTPLADIDVVYFDPADIEEQTEKRYEERLKKILPEIPWSVKNEARMHVLNQMPPYTSAVDAISKFSETATALGVKLTDDNQVILTAPCGIEDAAGLQVKPTRYFIENKNLSPIYEMRIAKKNWQSTWPKLRIHPL